MPGGGMGAAPQLGAPSVPPQNMGAMMSDLMKRLRIQQG
jgi:hypothetical protein